MMKTSYLPSLQRKIELPVYISFYISQTYKAFKEFLITRTISGSFRLTISIKCEIHFKYQDFLRALGANDIETILKADLYKR